MKKKYLIIAIISCFIFNQSYGDNSCSYESQIKKCYDMIQSDYTTGTGTYISKGESIKDFDDFVCIQGSYEEIALQVTMDLKFREIDDQMDEYLTTLNQEKDKYFSQDSEYSYFDGVNDIWAKTKEFDSLYTNACKETYACMDGISNKEALEYVAGSGGDCYGLKDVKLEIFNEVAFNILLLNKGQVLKDEKKLYEQETRTKYNNLLDLMMINLGYVERIRQKWPTKIANAY